MKMRIAVLTATLLGSLPLAFAPLRASLAQTAVDHVALGDKDHTAGNAAGALRHYQAALQADAKNANALWRASREAIDLGEFDDKSRDSLYTLGEQYARHAVGADSNSALTRFVLAKAIGRRALSMGSRDRVKFAGDVHREALASLRIDSINPGALHIMGRWHANIMRLSGFSRFMAKNLLGGKTFGEANWDDAARYLERAAALEPERIVHPLELASVYRDRGEKDKAREQYQRVLSLKPVEYNDTHYQKQAERELAELK